MSLKSTPCDCSCPGEAQPVATYEAQEADSIRVAPRRPQGVRYVSLDEVRRGKLQGMRTAGTVLDNHALMILCEDASTEIDRQEREIERHRRREERADRAVLGLKVQLTQSALKRIEFAQEVAHLEWTQGNDVY